MGTVQRGAAAAAHPPAGGALECAHVAEFAPSAGWTCLSSRTRSRGSAGTCMSSRRSLLPATMRCRCGSAGTVPPVVEAEGGGLGGNQGRTGTGQGVRDCRSAACSPRGATRRASRACEGPCGSCSDSASGGQAASDRFGCCWETVMHGYKTLDPEAHHAWRMWQGTMSGKAGVTFDGAPPFPFPPPPGGTRRRVLTRGRRAQGTGAVTRWGRRATRASRQRWTSSRTPFRCRVSRLSSCRCLPPAPLRACVARLEAHRCVACAGGGAVARGGRVCRGFG